MNFSFWPFLWFGLPGRLLTEAHTEFSIDPTLPKVQTRKKSTKINFFGPETAGWGGCVPPEGMGVEKFVPSLESLSSLGFQERNLGCPGNFARMSRGVQKVCAKKVRAHFSFPTSTLHFEDRKPRWTKMA